MSVGVIACQLTVIQPDDTLHIREEQAQPSVNILFCEWLIAVCSCQAAGCRKERTVSVALYRTAFQHKVLVIFQCTAEESCFINLPVDTVVLLGCKLPAPSVETEVEQVDWLETALGLHIRYEGDGSNVSCPRVIAVTGEEGYPPHLSLCQSFCQ